MYSILQICIRFVKILGEKNSLEEDNYGCFLSSSKAYYVL